MPTKVLIVDDEIDTCRMFALGLKVAGLQAEYALSGTQALANIGSVRPNAVVLDLMMPDIDGYEVTRRIRANPSTANIPIFVVTATADANAEADCMEAGATRFIRKPVHLKELAEIIKKTLE